MLERPKSIKKGYVAKSQLKLAQCGNQKVAINQLKTKRQAKKVKVSKCKIRAKKLQQNYIVAKH